jgi:hypothetical protein
LTDELGDEEALEFPAQASLTRPLIQTNNGSASAAFLPLWAGQGAPLIRDLPAAKLIDKRAIEAGLLLPRT